MLYNKHMKRDKSKPIPPGQKEHPFKDPEAAALFQQIFGSGREPPPSWVVAAKVVHDFCEQFPDMKEHHGKSRGTLDLAQYATEKGANVHDKKEKSDRMWDEEIFITQMKTLRGWNLSKINQKWNELKSDPGTDRDNDGPDGALRLEIPSNLLGLCSKVSGKEEFEQKKLVQMSRAKRMADTEKEKIMSEMHSGFSSGGRGSKLNENWSTKGPSGMEESTSLGMMRAAVGKQPAPLEGASSPAAGRGASGAEAAVEQGVPQASPSKGSQSDVGRDRYKMFRDLTAGFEGERKKFAALMKSAYIAMLSSDPEHDADFLSLLSQRSNIAQHFWGEFVTVSEDSAHKEMADLTTNDLNMRSYVYDRKVERAVNE